MQRAMAAEAEAARGARAKVIAAEGEQNASRALKEASDIIASSPAALQVPYPFLFFLIHYPNRNPGSRALYLVRSSLR